MSRQIVKRGELYWMDWNPARGSEQAGRRPGLVIQENNASSNPNYRLTIVATVSTKGFDIPAHVSVKPSNRNGLTAPSFIKCEHLLTISKDRLLGFIGELDEVDMDLVNRAIRRTLAL